MGNTVTGLWVQERDKLGKKDEELEACDDKQFEDSDVNSDSGKKDEELVAFGDEQFEDQNVKSDKDKEAEEASGEGALPGILPELAINII